MSVIADNMSVETDNILMEKAKKSWVPTNTILLGRS